MTTQTVTIDTSEQNSGPTLQESAAALVEEGLMSAEDAGIEPNTDATNGGEGASQGEEGSGGGQDDRPQGLPEKFKSVEDLVKSYTELEKKLSKGEQADTKDTQDTPEGDDGTAREAVENAGLDFDVLASEYEENGELSEAAYKALEESGVPKSIVDNYIAGIEAQKTLYEGSVKSLAGGEDAYADLIAWGGSNLSDAEIDAFDTAVNSGNLGTAKAAVEGLKARMELANGTEPTRQLDGKGNSTADVYESQAQIESDMNDPRYASDPAFRAKVYAKMERSNI